MKSLLHHVRKMVKIASGCTDIFGCRC